LTDFVSDLNTFVYLCRVRLFPCRVASKKGYEAVSVNAYRTKKYRLTYSVKNKNPGKYAASVRVSVDFPKISSL
jgi:hypothetical protein